MPKRNIEELSMTIANLASLGMKPKELTKAVKAKHPEASGKDITRAALYAMILSAGTDLEKARRLQEFSIVERSLE
jgi:hypothetical protein